jgi:hypothetical protein
MRGLLRHFLLLQSLRLLQRDLTVATVATVAQKSQKNFKRLSIYFYTESITTVAIVAGIAVATIKERDLSLSLSLLMPWTAATAISATVATVVILAPTLTERKKYEAS